MKKGKLKKFGIWTVAVIVSLSMAISPVFMADTAFASEFNMDDETLDKLDGMTVKQVEKDENLAPLLEDPIFLSYFEITDSGKIKKKKTETDEIDEFIANMDKNAEGIDSKELADVNSDMNCMGCGVTGLGKAQTPSKYKNNNRYHCIDISWWQGKVSDANWQKIKAAGVTHVILRVGYSSLSNGAHNSDSVFSNNLNGAYKAGMKVGVYYYSTAKTAAEAKSEAQYTVKLLQNYKSKISMPVAYDYETGGRLTASVMKKNGTASCKAYCDYIESQGYDAMVYANYTTLKSYLDYKTLQNKYKIWLANYTTNGTATTYPGEYWIWQYSSSGKVNGLSGSIDMNYIFGGVQSDTSKDNSSSDESASEDSHTGTITAKTNYRTGPGTSYTKKGYYNKGSKVSMAKRTGDWAKLTNGYYISLSNVTFKATVLSTVNYRTGPGTSYTKKGSYSPGKTLTVVRVKNGWAKLSNGYWLKAKYIEMF